MKIISTYKDYYDFIAHSFGGGDPKVPYKRLAFRPQDVPELTTFTMDPSYAVPRTPEFYRFRNQYEFKTLSVMARRYLLVKPSATALPWRVLSPKEHKLLYETIAPQAQRKRFLWEDSSVRDYIGKEVSEGLLRLTKELGQPVFSYNTLGHSRLVIDRLLPNLGDMGFAALYEPAQLYQDLAYFIGNVMSDSPDLATPSKMTDKEKISQHGFDLKQSFRHRTG